MGPRNLRQKRSSPKVGGDDLLVPLDIKEAFGVTKEQLEAFISDLFLTAIFANIRKKDEVVTLLAYWSIMRTELGLGSSATPLIATTTPQTGGNGDELAVRDPVTDVSTQLTSAQTAVLATVPAPFRGVLTTSFETLNIKQDALQARIKEIKQNSKTGILGAVATALIGLVAGLASGANDIIDIVGPSVLRAEANVAAASVVTGATVGGLATAADAASQAALTFAVNLDATVMGGLHALVKGAPVAADAVTSAASSIWRDVGTVTTNTRAGRAAAVSEAAAKAEEMSKLAQATFDIDWGMAIANERARNISSQTSTALAMNPKGTETGTMELETFFSGIRNKKPSTETGDVVFNTAFFTVNWAWVYAYNAEKWTKYSITQAHRLALQALVVSAKNPVAVSLVLFKLGIGAVAGLAILPAFQRYLAKIHSAQELELAVAEWTPQIKRANEEIERLLSRFPPAAIADAAPAAQGGRRRLTSRRRRRAAYLPRQTRRSSSGRRRGYSRRQRG